MNSKLFKKQYNTLFIIYLQTKNIYIQIEKSSNLAVNSNFNHNSINRSSNDKNVDPKLKDN